MDCGCFGTSSTSSRRNNGHKSQGLEGSPIGNTKTFPYNVLRVATNNFNRSNKIGRGGFGAVYMGILKNGTPVAVKTLSVGSRQGTKEFMTEIITIANVRHQNLVELIGCCIEGTNRILVYEYLENKSLDSALLGKTLKLDWNKRRGICIGIARGLAYLHEEIEPHIVHRDIKASNILLDQDFNPKIGDFGLAKLFPEDITHISTNVAGTTGYLAPEYGFGGQLTRKADVYSFGVLVLEIISGRRSTKSSWSEDQKFLLELAWDLHSEGKLVELIDPEMDKLFPEEEVIKYAKIGLFCVQAIATRRPMMSQVMDMLTRDVRINENQLTPPGFFQDTKNIAQQPSSSSSSQTKKVSGIMTSNNITSVPTTITQVTPR